jgi:hypothetical protein
MSPYFRACDLAMLGEPRPAFLSAGSGSVSGSQCEIHGGHTETGLSPRTLVFP